MKILLVNHTLKAGGAERQFVELIKGLSEVKYISLEVLLFNDIIEYDELRKLPVSIHIFPKRSALDSNPFCGLKEVISTFRPDIVHSWHWVCNFYIIPLSYLYDFKFIDGSLRDANKPHLLSAINLINRLCWIKASCVVANSYAGLKAYGAVKKGKVIYNGLDVYRFSKNDTIPKSNWSQILMEPGNLKIAMIARFHNHKDYDTYLEVADKMSKKNTRLFFFAIGEGPRLEELRHRYTENKNIIFTGRISYVERFIQLIDIGVLLTNPNKHAEGISNALLEFMCAGKAVIASYGGGTTELIKNKDNGLLIDALSHSEFEVAVNQLVQSTATLKKYGQNGKMFVYDNFSFDKMIKNYLNLYQDQLKQQSLSIVN